MLRMSPRAKPLARYSASISTKSSSVSRRVGLTQTAPSSPSRRALNRTLRWLSRGHGCRRLDRLRSTPVTSSSMAIGSVCGLTALQAACQTATIACRPGLVRRLYPSPHGAPTGSRRHALNTRPVQLERQNGGWPACRGQAFTGRVRRQDLERARFLVIASPSARPAGGDKGALATTRWPSVPVVSTVPSLGEGRIVTQREQARATVTKAAAKLREQDANLLFDLEQMRKRVVA